jgi:hypothetical protein
MMQKRLLGLFIRLRLVIQQSNVNILPWIPVLVGVLERLTAAGHRLIWG